MNIILLKTPFTGKTLFKSWGPQTLGHNPKKLDTNRKNKPAFGNW